MGIPLTPPFCYFRMVDSATMPPHRRILFCLLLLASSIALRAPFLQRAIWNVDEGITVTAAERILDGGVLYRDIADQRSPLVPYLKAGILAACGHWNTTAIHAVLAVMLGVAALGLWQIGRLLGNERAGAFAAAVFTVLCFLLPTADDALAAHTEWFLVFFSVAGFAVLAKASHRPSLWAGAASGALFGLATLAKQPGLFDWAVALVISGLFAVVEPEQRRAWRNAAFGLVLGFATAIAFAIGYLVWRGAGADALYYGWTYNNQVYVPAVPLVRRLATMLEPFHLAARHAPVIFALGLTAAVVLPVVAVRGWRRAEKGGLQVLPWLALGWTAAGILASSLSGRAFSHYSIQAIPGLSLACGLVLALVSERVSARGPAVRTCAAAVLGVALVMCGRELAERIASTECADPAPVSWVAPVRELTAETDRVFFWGFTPDCYVQARRLPATRFVYTTFLTGMVPWANVDPLIDTSDLVTPGSWDSLREDFARTPPRMIVDTGVQRHQGKYPLHAQTALWSLITRDYAEVRVGTSVPGGFRYYRRLDAAASAPMPAALPHDESVKLVFESHTKVGAVPRFLITAPAGAARVSLLEGGKAVRTLDTPDGQVDVAFSFPAGDLSESLRQYTAAVQYREAIRTSAPLEVARRDARPRLGVPGPAILLEGCAISPTASETLDGQPDPFPDDPTFWRTHATAELVYDRPAGLRAFTFRFGLAQGCYYDTPEHRASDGVDFVVEYLDPASGRSRLFERRMYPKTRQQDCGEQSAEITLPGNASGQIVVRVLPGPANNVDFDWAYLGAMRGVGYGPPLAWAGGAIPAENVSAHDEPVMTCDAERRWTAHSPSSVSYGLPADVSALSFDYGLEPASYDGSQGGRTDGIGVVVTGELAGGEHCILFERTLAPAEIAADRGRQTAHVDLRNRNVRRVTIAVSPGPNGNFSYDWSYLADLHAEAEPLALAP